MIKCRCTLGFPTNSCVARWLIHNIHASIWPHISADSTAAEWVGSIVALDRWKPFHKKALHGCDKGLKQGTKLLMHESTKIMTYIHSEGCWYKIVIDCLFQLVFLPSICVLLSTTSNFEQVNHTPEMTSYPDANLVSNSNSINKLAVATFSFAGILPF